MGRAKVLFVVDEMRIPPSRSFLEYHCCYPLFQDKKMSKREESDKDSDEEVLFFTAW